MKTISSISLATRTFSPRPTERRSKGVDQSRPAVFETHDTSFHGPYGERGSKREWRER